MDNQMIQKQIGHALKNQPEVLAVYVIGSFAQGHPGKDSDYDLAVLD